MGLEANDMSDSDNRELFVKQLSSLKDGEYISHDHYRITIDAFEKFKLDQEAIKENVLAASAVSINVAEVKAEIPKQAEENERRITKKRLSPEEIRERNISWLLNIGVLMLLIGGIYIATSNWSTMSNVMKSGCIALISVLFYGIAIFADKVLKIKKTSFAFYVLASLFLPILILSIAWFELLGTYFSFYGQGRFLLGALGSICLLPVYFLLAKKLNSRLFAWFVFITMTFLAGYTLAFVRFTNDLFYLGMTFFSFLYVMGYHWLRKKKQFLLFIEQFKHFVQIQLIFTTVFMTLFFEDHVIHSASIIMAACLFLAIVFISGNKEYHFAFSLLIVYGAYQLIEHSFLSSVSPILYCFVAISFLAVPKLLVNKGSWEEVFQLTSAAAAIIAFIYISVEKILANLMEPSYALLVAFIFLAGQFLYLQSRIQGYLFKYSPPIFIAAFLFEVMLFAQKIYAFNDLLLPYFLIGFILHLVFGHLIKHHYIVPINNSSKNVGLIIMVLSVCAGVSFCTFLQAGTMLLLLTGVFMLLYRFDNRKYYQDSCSWLIPFVLGCAFLFFGEEMNTSFEFYNKHLGITISAFLASAVLFIFNFISKYTFYADIKRQIVYTAQGFYTLSIIFSIFFSAHTAIRPSIFLIGSVVYAALYFMSKNKWIPYISSFVFLFGYLFSLNAFTQLPVFFTKIMWPFGAILLFVIGYSFLKKDFIFSRGYFVTGHLYLPVALFLNLIFNGDQSLYSFVGAAVIYLLSAKRVNKEVFIRIFLYGSFLSIFIFMVLLIHIAFSTYYSHYAYISLSIFVFAYWKINKENNKKRIEDFLIPWSIIGLLAFLNQYPFGLPEWLSLIVYSLLVIAFIHVRGMSILNMIPLFILFVSTHYYILSNAVILETAFNVVLVFALVFLFGGSLLSKKLYHVANKWCFIDVYTIISCLYLLSLYAYQLEALWTKLLPGLLIAVLLWMQRKRVKQYWVPAVCSVIYLLQPYYAFINEVRLPAYFEREFYMLPLVCVIIVIRLILNGRFRYQTSYLEWGILVVVALTLVIDALNSNQVNDALILGTLTIIALLAGIYFRKKSYFFVGSIVLLINVILQSRPFWGNLPWWSYLLMGGSLLITVASFYEWNKQKMGKGEVIVIVKIKNRLRKNFREWQ